MLIAFINDLKVINDKIIAINLINKSEVISWLILLKKTTI